MLDNGFGANIIRRERSLRCEWRWDEQCLRATLLSRSITCKSARKQLAHHKRSLAAWLPSSLEQRMSIARGTRDPSTAKCGVSLGKSGALPRFGDKVDKGCMAVNERVCST